VDRHRQAAWPARRPVSSSVARAKRLPVVGPLSSNVRPHSPHRVAFDESTLLQATHRGVCLPSSHADGLVCVLLCIRCYPTRLRSGTSWGCLLAASVHLPANPEATPRVEAHEALFAMSLLVRLLALLCFGPPMLLLLGVVPEFSGPQKTSDWAIQGHLGVWWCSLLVALVR
jgi:hypothetical protein